MIEIIGLVAASLILGAAHYFSLKSTLEMLREIRSGRSSADTLSTFLGKDHNGGLADVAGPPNANGLYDTTNWSSFDRPWSNRLIENPISEALALLCSPVAIATNSWWPLAASLAWIIVAYLVPVLHYYFMRIPRDGELARCHLLPLKAPLSVAIHSWGETEETPPGETDSDPPRLFFVPSDMVGVTAAISVWNDEIHAIEYRTSGKNPDRDLESLLRAYGGPGEWTPVNEGYWYKRKDGSAHLFCSAMPWYSIVTDEYRSETQTSDVSESEQAQETDV